jgi:hypothetical protein
MKFSTGAILLASLSTASAFVQPAQRAATFSRRFVVSEHTKIDEAAKDIDATPEKAPPVVVAAEPVAAAEPAVAVAEPKSVLDDSVLKP